MSWQVGSQWYVSVRDESGKKKFHGFSKREDADFFEQFSKRPRARARKERKIDSLQSLVARAKKDGRLMESRNMDRMITAMGAWALKPGSELTVQAIADCLDFWNSRYAYATVFLYVKMLKRALHVIGYYEQYFENLRQAMPVMRQPRNRTVTVSDENFDLIYQRAPLGYKFLLLVTRDAGLRMAEAMSIRPSMIDYSSNIVRFLQKGRSERTAVLTERIIELSKLCPNSERRCVDQLMPDLHGAPRFVSQEAARQWLKRTRTKLNLPEFSFHDLRRSVGTAFHRRTKDLFALKEFLGHESIASTIAYIKPFPPQEFSQIIEDIKPKLSQEKTA